MKALALLLVALGAVPAARAAGPEAPDAAQVAGMARIAWMAGEWRGTATMKRPEGEARMASSEKVDLAAGGTAMFVRGLHRLIQPDGTPGPVVHDAAGMITYDPATSKFRFVTQLATGRGGTYEATMVDGRFRWILPVQGGAQIRYDIWRSDTGQWLEEGEFCAPGAPCRPFFSMRLERQ